MAETIYPYENESGEPVHEVVRCPGKKFAQRRRGPDGTPTYKLDGAERIPYGLPELRRAVVGIQSVSHPQGDVAKRRVYAHTGWSRIDCRTDVFIHALGAISEFGAMALFEVSIRTQGARS